MDGEKAPRKLHQRKQWKMVPEKAGSGGDHQGGDEEGEERENRDKESRNWQTRLGATDLQGGGNEAADRQNGLNQPHAERSPAGDLIVEMEAGLNQLLPPPAKSEGAKMVAIMEISAGLSVELYRAVLAQSWEPIECGKSET